MAAWAKIGSRQESDGRGAAACGAQKPGFGSAQNAARSRPVPDVEDLLGDTIGRQRRGRGGEEQPMRKRRYPTDDPRGAPRGAFLQYAQDRRGAKDPMGCYVDELGNRIFDYETNTAQASSYDHTAQPAPVAEERAGDEEPYQFDLRQAVISQTILHNEYVSD